MMIVVQSQFKDVESRYPSELFDKRWYANLIKAMRGCITEKISFPLTIILVDEESIRAINKEYRALSRVTDVLSFAYTERGFIESGEVYLCPSQALKQRGKFRTTKKQEIARLFVHGVLHILGYDHTTVAPRRIMRKLEDCSMSTARTLKLC